MQLKHGVDLGDFLQAVCRCRETVCFATAGGDVLNLKSEIARYVFAVIAADEQQLLSGEILCSDLRDEQTLCAYMEKE